MKCTPKTMYSRYYGYRCFKYMAMKKESIVFRDAIVEWSISLIRTLIKMDDK